MESLWRRAWRDTEHFRASGWFFWGFEVIGAVLFGAVGALQLPDTPSKVQSALYPGLGILSGLLLFFLLAFGWNLFMAPYRQRNEALILLTKRPKPIRLQDRGKLVRTIHEAMTATIQFIEVRRQVAELYEKDPNDINEDKASSALQESKTRYTEALRLLECEKLVAGNGYEPLIDLLVMLMNLGATYWNSTTSGGRDYLSTFQTRLEANVRETIKHIDRLNPEV